MKNIQKNKKKRSYAIVNWKLKMKKIESMSRILRYIDWINHSKKLTTTFETFYSFSLNQKKNIIY